MSNEIVRREESALVDVSNKERIILDALKEIKDQKQNVDLNSVTAQLFEQLGLEVEPGNIDNAITNIALIANTKAQSERESERRSERRLRILSTLRPYFIWLTTLAVGTVFAVWWQEAAFNRNANFQATIARYEQAQTLASDILADIQDVEGRIPIFESDPAQMRRLERLVRKSRNDLNHLEDVLRTLSPTHTDALNRELLLVFEELDSFLRSKELLTTSTLRSLRNEISQAFSEYLRSSRR